MVRTVQHYILALLLACLVAIGIWATPSRSTHAQESSSDVSAMLAQIQQLLELVQDLQEQLNALKGEVRETLRAGLQEGMTDEDIRKIQQILATDPEIYPEGLTTGYFGPLTRNALVRFQRRHDLEVTGRINDETRELLEEYLQEKFGDDIPPGLLRAPGIKAKVERRYRDRCDDSRGMAFLCKRLKDKYEDDDGDDSSDDSDDSDDSDNSSDDSDDSSDSNDGDSDENDDSDDSSDDDSDDSEDEDGDGDSDDDNASSTDDGTDDGDSDENDDDNS